MALPLIDNFSEGADNVPLDSGDVYRLQGGSSILGGKRQTYLQIISSAYNQRPGAILQISDGSLILDTGARVHRGLQVGYGHNHTSPWGYFRLDLDLSPYSLFRINFLFSEGSPTDGLNMQVSSAAGDPSEHRLPSGVTFQAGLSALPLDTTGPFAVDLRYGDFLPNPVAGAPANLSKAVGSGMKIDTILLLFGGTPVGASNFAIDSIECV